MEVYYIVADDHQQRKKMEINKEKWIEWLEVRGLSNNTIQKYAFYFDKFNPRELNQDYCITFLRQHKGLTIPRAFIMNLLRYIIKSDLPEELRDIAMRIDIPPSKRLKPKKDINILSFGEVTMLKDAMPSIKHKLMVLITFYGGLRASELVGDKELSGLLTDSFHWEWWKVNTDKFCPMMVKGKGKKRRKVYVPPNVAGVLMEWIDHYFSIKHTRDQKLFSMGVRRWEKILEKYSQKALGRRVNPHLLRHSCANYLKQQGLDIESIRKYLGHADIRTTQTYLHLTDPELEGEITGAFS